MLEIEEGKTTIEIDETKLRKVEIRSKGVMYIQFVDGEIIVSKENGIAILEAFLLYLKSL